MSTAPTTRPYGRHVLLCAHGDCAEPPVVEALRGAVREELGNLVKLRNPERVKWTLTGCLGVCEGGPICVVYPDGVWYHHVDEQAMRRIVREHLLRGEPVAELAFHHHYPAGHGPGYAPRLRGDEGSYRAPRRSPPAEEASALAVPAAPRPGAASSGAAAPERPADGLLSQEEKEERRRRARESKVKRGLLIVNTGEGKGKTTAALGIILRAWGRGMRTGLLQFMKHEGARFGEILALEKMGVERIGLGDGFTWTSRDLDETRARAVAGWELARQRITSGEYDVLVLDELTYPLHYGWIDAAEVVAFLREHKPRMLHLVITGRYAPPELVELADLVSDVANVKHPLEQQGIRAQRGVDF